MKFLFACKGPGIKFHLDAGVSSNILYVVNEKNREMNIGILINWVPFRNKILVKVVGQLDAQMLYWITPPHAETRKVGKIFI